MKLKIYLISIINITDAAVFKAKGEEFLATLDDSFKQCDKAGTLLKASSLSEKLTLKGTKCAFVIQNPDKVEMKVALQPAFQNGKIEVLSGTDDVIICQDEPCLTTLPIITIIFEQAEADIELEDALIVGTTSIVRNNNSTPRNLLILVFFLRKYQLW